MRVCVTGGTGFIGGALVRRLLAEGAQVHVLARASQRADELEARGVDVVRGDLSDPEAIERAVREAEVVYHAAAKIDPPGARAEFFETNVRGTERVLQECLRAGVGRAVCISSIAVYGPVREGEPINEDTPYDGAPEKRDLYSQSKIASDQLAVSFAEKTGLPVAILRPGVVYGPGRPLPAGLLAFRLGKTDFVFGNRDHRIPLSYVENLIDAVQLVAGLKDGKPRQYVVVDDENLTLGQYHAAKREADGTRTLFLPGWPVLLAAPLSGPPPRQVKRALQNRWYDTRRIREETGWAPRVPLREGIRRALTTSG
jgi:nucleoside-diphosphate-sugar epimerase